MYIVASLLLFILIPLLSFSTYFHFLMSFLIVFIFSVLVRTQSLLYLLRFEPILFLHIFCRIIL